jgi:hypothetical protein
MMARIQKRHHIRSIEVTYGENGYHPHVHTLLFLDRELTDTDKSAFAESWKRAVEQELGPRYVPDDEHGTTIDESYRTDYIAKLGLEVAAITTKSAKNGNRTMWTVAADAAGGDKESGAVWARYVRDMFGCRQLFWSKGAKQYFRIQRMTDEQIASDGLAEGTPLGVACVLAQWQGHQWDSQTRANPYWLTEVVTKTLQGAASLAELPGQDVTTPEGHVPIKRYPMNMAVAHYPEELTEAQKQDVKDYRAREAKKGLALRANFDAWLRERGVQSLALTALQYSQEHSD